MRATPEFARECRFWKSKARRTTFSPTMPDADILDLIDFHDVTYMPAYLMKRYVDKGWSYENKRLYYKLITLMEHLIEVNNLE